MITQELEQTRAAWDDIAAYFDTTLRRRPNELLRQDSPEFPEVHIRW